MNIIISNIYFSELLAVMKKDFVKDFEKKVKKTIKEYGLFTKKDRLFVACSGGKDSTTALYLAKKLGYKVEAIMIDLKMGEWSERNLSNMKEFCKKHKIKLNIIDIKEEYGCGICYIRSCIQDKIKIGNCTICGVIRRWLLNKKTRELGATRLLTGHNLDDEAENVIMNLMKGNPELFINLGPKTGIIEDPKFVQRAKPLYFCTNAEIRRYTEEMGWNIVYEPCPCSVGVFRREIREIMTALEKKDPQIKQKLVNKVLEILPKIKASYRLKIHLMYCRVCGEPSRGEICKRCSLIKAMTTKPRCSPRPDIE